MKIEPTAAIIPPIRQLILLGETLEKSMQVRQVSNNINSDSGNH